MPQFPQHVYDKLKGMLVTVTIGDEELEVPMGEHGEELLANALQRHHQRLCNELVEEEKELDEAHKCVCYYCDGLSVIRVTRMGSDNMDFDIDEDPCDECHGRGFIYMMPWTGISDYPDAKNPLINKAKTE